MIGFNCKLLFLSFYSKLIMYAKIIQNDIKDLHYAAVTGQLDRIADKEYRQQVYLSKDQNGLSAFHRAVANGHKQIAEHLMEKTDRAIVNQVFSKKKYRLDYFIAMKNIFLIFCLVIFWKG